MVFLPTQAYEAVLAVCNALVPGDAPELVDGLMETTNVYRKRYGYKKRLFDLQGDETLVRALCLCVRVCA